MNETHSKARRRSAAFTLVELLVVMGVIALLVSILLPALTGARRAAQAVQCAANIRQICNAMFDYASSNRGRFPPNIPVFGGSKSQNWYDDERIGRLVGAHVSPGGVSGGGVLVCPQDEDAWRSYSMNRWASSKVDIRSLDRKLWSKDMPNSSQLMLITESWSSLPESAVGWSAQPTVGFRGNSAGKLFGGSTSFFAAGRWRSVNCELAYNRHRNGRGTGTQPVGRLNIGYADGHVETVSNDALVNPATKLSRFHSLWSDMDFQYP